MNLKSLILILKCQKWDLNPRPRRGPELESGALDHSAILTMPLDFIP